MQWTHFVVVVVVVDLLFYVPFKNFYLNVDVTVTGEGLQNLGLCSGAQGP
jgi:hypothetical protein